MKKYIYNIALIFAAAFLFACEKEIYLDYESIDPQYVIEAVVEDNVYEVKLSMTRDMNQAQSQSIAGATVMITSPDGMQHLLPYIAQEQIYRYKAQTSQLGEHKLNVQVDDKTFTSSSVRSLAPMPETFIARREDLLMMGKHLGLRYTFHDFEGEPNFYVGRAYVNGEVYTRRDIRDDHQDGEILDMYVLLEEFGVNENQDPQEDYLHDGDTVVITISSIDENVWLYWNSMSVAQSGSSNPISNINGGALGYFSAQSTIEHTYVYDKSSI